MVESQHEPSGRICIDWIRGTRLVQGEKEKEKKKERRVLLTIDVMSAPLYLISQRIVLCRYGRMYVGCR